MSHEVARRTVLQAGTIAFGVAAFNWLGAESAQASETGSAGPLDMIAFGDSRSETAHQLVATGSSVVASAALGQAARVFHPAAPAAFWGGKVGFTMACRPTGTTYVTVKLWGGEFDSTSKEASSGTNMWRLQLFCDGLQVGYEDQGAVDCLDILDTAPRTPGRFYFHTIPLPEKMTAGKRSVNLEVRSLGRIWPYGQNQDQLYYDMTTDSRKVYRLYTHSDPCFVPAHGDVQGPAPVPGVQSSPGIEAVAAVRARVAADQATLLTDATPATMDGWAMQSLAEGYLWSGSPAYQQGIALDRVLQAIDGRYFAWKSDPTVLTGSDQQWQGFGRVGLVLALLWDKLGDRLSERVTGSRLEVANPSFENGGARPVNWDVPGWGDVNADWSRDTTVSHSGGASLKLEAGAGGFITCYSTPKTLVTAGLTYTFGAWVKTVGTSGEGAYIDPLFFDDSGKLVGSDHKYYSTTGTHDWEFVSAALAVPAGATQVEVHLRLANAGTAWFDDVEFTAPQEFSNPGFELGGATPAFWAVPSWGQTDASWARDSTVAHGGGSSVRLDVSSASGFITAFNTARVQVGPGTYSYGAWIKSQGTTGIGAHIDPLFYDSSGKLVGSDHRQFATTGTHDWEYVSIDLPTPAGATQVELHLRVAGTGTAWFDDVTLVAPATAASPLPPVRHDAYVDMLLSSRDYWRQHFPHYSNQVQICAIGLYQANRGLGLLEPSLALSEEKIRGYLYQSLGMTPYSGPEDAEGNPSWPLGHGYHQVTAQGLTRELGYVGSYGEVTDWLVMMYESVTRGYGGQSAPELLQQMITMVKARGNFRVVDVDADNARVVRVEAVVGWRNEEYPGNVAYAGRTAWDASPIQSAVVFQDPDLIGWCQEMVADGQLFPQLDLQINHPWTRVGLNALRFIARDWPAFQALPASAERMPTGWDRPDFVFADPEDGVVAVKHGRELLFMSLYFRARQGINNYARVHLVDEVNQRSATIRQSSHGATSASFTAQDWVLWDYAINDPGAGGIPPGGFPPPGDTVHQAAAGDVVYLAPVPADVPDPTLGVHFTGVETLLVGKAPFYLAVYGDYLVAMNTTSDLTYSVPARDSRFGPAQWLNGTGKNQGRIVGAGEKISVAPGQTVVLRRV